MKIVLISCVSLKLDIPATAHDMYISELFKKSLKYAKFQNPDKIFVLSAKYGLLPMDKVIEPYNKTLNSMTVFEKREWSAMVLKQLIECTNVNEDEYIFLAGENYRKYILGSIKKYSIPMIGLGIGKQLKFLKANTNEA